MITRDDCATTAWPGGDGPISLGSDAYLRVPDICAMLKVDRHTVYKWIDNDLLPVVRVNARVQLIPRGSLERLLAPRSDRKS